MFGIKNQLLHSAKIAVESPEPMKSEFRDRWKLAFSGTLANVYLAEGKP